MDLTNAIAIDSQNHVFVIDGLGYSIKKYDSNGQLLSEWYLKVPHWVLPSLAVFEGIVLVFCLINLFWRLAKR